MKTPIVTLAVATLTATSLACSSPKEIAAKHESAMTAKLDAMKKVCAAFATDRTKPAKRRDLPDKLVVMRPSEGRTKNHNAVLMDGDWCPGLKILLDDPKKSLGSSNLNVGYAFPITNLAGIYLRDDKYQWKRYEADTSELRVDIEATGKLDYAILWHMDHIDFPTIDAEKETFTGGTFRGKFLVYRLSDGKMLSSVPVESHNDKDKTISHGDKTITRTERDYNAKTQRTEERTRSQTLHLGSFASAARTQLMLDLTFATDDAAAKAVPYEDAR